MTRLSSEAKESILRQALNKKGKSLVEIAHMNNIGYSTLQKWLRKRREGGTVETSKPINTSKAPDTAAQLTHLLATSQLDETELGVYCRRHGIYSHQLTHWKTDLMSNSPPKKQAQQQAELKRLKAENKQLKQELQRKEKALAEASTLLILKKKASSIWGEHEDD